MTGQGQGRNQFGTAEITAEVRAVNNRHLKIQTRTSDGLGGVEQKIEALVRKHLRRGSLQLGVQVSGTLLASNYRLQEPVLKDYVQQCREFSERMGLDAELRLGELLGLPGVVADPRSEASHPIDESLESQILATVGDALESLNRMRRAEGDSMAGELSNQLQRLRKLTLAIEQLAPKVIDDYRERLRTRLDRALSEVGDTLQESDLIREVLIMADKADIREEIVRLRSHFDQFEQLLAAEQSQGRKLDFLIQEIFRETNTIGSKAGDANIAQRVVDMKTAIEQMRELVQNAE